MNMMLNVQKLIWTCILLVLWSCCARVSNGTYVESKVISAYLERNMCEHPKHYLSKISSKVGDTIVCDTTAQGGGFFFQAGTTCSFNCSKGKIRNSWKAIILNSIAL